MKLYYIPGASSLAPHIVMREAGLPVDLVKVDGKTRKLPDGGDYLAVNPKGYVPTLELDNGERLTEVAAILLYLADQAPSAGLAPASGDFARYRLQEWLNFIATELHKFHGPLFDPRAAAETKDSYRRAIKGRYDWLNATLKGRALLTGASFSVADAYLFVVLSWARWVNLDLREWSVLNEYSARIATRPAVQEAMRAEGLVK